MKYSAQQQEGRWQRRKEDRPAEIIEAALELFVENGYANTRLDDIAQKAGISKGSLYRYFDNKADLFKSMVIQVVVPQIEQAEIRVNEYQGSIAPLLRTMILEWWETVGESRICGIPKLIISEAGQFPELASFYVENVIQRGRKLVTMMIQRGIDSGEFREDIPAEYAARLLISPLIFTTIYQQSLADFDDDYDVSTLLSLEIEIFINGATGEARS